jgi:hypothetical protein
VVQAATVAVTNHTITSTEAAQVQTQALSSRALLDAAKAAETAGNTAGANSDLVLATAALGALQQFLNARK